MIAYAIQAKRSSRIKMVNNIGLQRHAEYLQEQGDPYFRPATSLKALILLKGGTLF